MRLDIIYHPILLSAAFLCVDVYIYYRHIYLYTNDVLELYFSVCIGDRIGKKEEKGEGREGGREGGKGRGGGNGWR